MDGLIKSVIVALARSASADVAASTRQTAAGALSGMIAALLASAAIGCAIAALWIFTAPMIGVPGAALVCAGGLMIASLSVLWLIPAIAKWLRPKPPQPAAQDILLTEAARLLKDHKALALAGALAAGLLLGGDRRDRRSV